jgi:hypothetical protein
VGSIHTIVGARALLVRSHPVTVSVGLFDDNDDAVVPTSWSVSLMRDGATVLSDTGAGAVDWTETIASNVGLGDDYYLQWVFTESDGTTTPYRQDAAVCLQDLHPVIRVQDLVDRVPRLSLDSGEPLLSVDDTEAKGMMLRAMSVAWSDLESWLWRRGNRSHLILNSYDLADLHTLHALEVLFAGVASSLGGQYLEMSRDWGRQYQAARRDLVLQYAPSTGDGAGQRQQAVGPIFSGGAFGAGIVYDYQRSIPSTRRR